MSFVDTPVSYQARFAINPEHSSVIQHVVKYDTCAALERKMNAALQALQAYDEWYKAVNSTPRDTDDEFQMRVKLLGEARALSVKAQDMKLRPES